MVSTLNELSQLRASGFGQPRPRHGLDLLYWFAHDYIDLSSGDVVLMFRPQDGQFGFHKYHNRIDDDEPSIVPTPSQNFPYYEVGNLNYRGADDLPNYVTRYYTNIPDSNKDRIIVRLDTDGRFNRAYVTEHSDPIRFDRRKTYRVSQGLLREIKRMSRNQYLSAVSNARDEEHVRLQSHYVTPPPNNDSWCAIL